MSDYRHHVRPFDNFALIVVLFVLLIIVGCGCFLGYGY